MLLLRIDSIFSARNSCKVKTMNMIRILARQKRGLKVVLVNAQSLNNKVDEFRYVFEKSDVDIVCISETWLLIHRMDTSASVATGYTDRIDWVMQAQWLFLWRRTYLAKFVWNLHRTSRIVGRKLNIFFSNWIQMVGDYWWNVFTDRIGSLTYQVFYWLIGHWSQCMMML